MEAVLDDPSQTCIWFVGGGGGQIHSRTIFRNVVFVLPVKRNIEIPTTPKSLYNKNSIHSEE